MTAVGLLAGQTVLVTGAARGIGAGIAVELAAHGANVVVNYRRSAEEAAAIVAEIEAAGGAAIAVQADVEDAAAVRAMVTTAVDRFGAIDTVVNNAYPGFRGGDIADVPWDIYRGSMESIMSGAIHVIQAVLPIMRERHRGSIVNIGTISLIGLNEHQSPYVVGKGALLSLTHVLARDLGPDNIRVNMVSPGTTWTDRTRPTPDDFAADRRAATPMGRLPVSADIAKAVVFYASDLSGFVTGTHLPVAGGLVIPSS